VGAPFQVGAKFGSGRSGGIEKAILVSLKSEERRTRPPGATAIAISDRCRFIAAMLAAGQDKGRALAALGQMAPKIWVVNLFDHRR
jgi:hypothetical protein